jgi:hypothetical protein
MSNTVLVSDDLLASATEQLSLVSVELAPTVEPPARAVREHPPCYAPCPTCGALVLTGETRQGEVVALDTQTRSYVPTWLPDTPRPVLDESRGYPVHQCEREVVVQEQ